MPPVLVTCFRCGETVEGYELPDIGTVGFVRVEGRWAKYGRPGEQAICDSCLMADPGYQADYPWMVSGPMDPKALPRLAETPNRSGQPVTSLALGHEAGAGDSAQEEGA